MHPSRKILLGLISLLFLASAGCRQTRLWPVGMVEVPEIRFPVSPGVEKMSYKARLETDRGDFTGIMVIKKMDDKEFRVAFFSELGMSYLEGAMAGTSYPYTLEINSTSPFLSSSRILNNLKASLNLLLVRKSDLVSLDILKDEGMNLWIKGKTTGGSYYWGRLDSLGKVNKAYFSKGSRQRSGLEAHFEYGDENSEVLSFIEISNKRGGVLLSLESY